MNPVQVKKIEILMEALKTLTKDSDEPQRKEVRQMLAMELRLL
jgi:hypothetical protein